MRPHKHVAPSLNDVRDQRFQQVMGTAVVRFEAPWGTTPVVATTELDRISIASWDAVEERWRYIERPHEPLTCTGLGPDAPNRWNWSAQVALAASRDAVFAVYKRQRLLGSELRTALTIDRFVPDDPSGGSRSLQLQDSTDVFVDSSNVDLGHHVWAEWDDGANELLLVYQAAGRLGSLLPRPWSVAFQRVAVGTTVAPADLQLLTPGGFEFDVRRRGQRLVIVHRAEPAPVRIPLLMTAGAGLTLTSGPESDPFHAPLRLLQYSLDDGTVTEEEIPGGEHPCIQSVDPLIITFDRPTGARIQLTTPLVVLPPGRRRYAWLEGQVDKVMWVRTPSGDARGTILTEAADFLPLSLVPLSIHTRLMEIEEGRAVVRAPFDTWPVHFLQLMRTDKGYLVDVLHHRSQRGLYRSRLDTYVSGAEVTVGSRTFEVWDIGHAQIWDPTERVPDATAENGQFVPFVAQPRSASVVGGIRPGTPDNTMGGCLTIDRRMSPVGFFAYTNLGDGGLRVIFAPDIRALGDPPPNDNEKLLRPEQVTGPPIPCDVWVKLDATDWADTQLPGYPAGIFRGGKSSLGAALERPVEAMLESLELALGANAPSPQDGITDADFDAVDTFVAGLGPGATLSLVASDGTPLVVTVTPAAPRRTQAFTVALTAAGLVPPAVVWTLVPATFAAVVPPGPIPPGPIPSGPIGGVVPGSAGNPATLSSSLAGAHRLSVFTTNAAGASITAFTDITLAPLIRDQAWALHDGLRSTADYRIGDLDASLLQYDFGFRAARDGTHERLTIGFPSTRRTRWRFRGGGDGQGQIDYQCRVQIRTTDMALRGVLASLFDVKSFTLDFSYARVFSPGMLMRDNRFRDPLRGTDISADPDETIQRRDPLAHAGVATKPVGDSSTPDHQATIDLSTRLPLVAISTIVAAVILIGVASLIVLVTALAVSIAAGIAAGILGAGAVAASLTVLLILMIFVVPLAAESYAVSRLDEQFTDGTMRKRLDDQALLRYAGEGLGEAIARRALLKARDDGHAVPAPFEPNSDDAGRDRFRGQLFQMVFVSDGVCRVLLRLDDCREVTPDIGLPDPPRDDDGPGFDPIGATGRRANPPASADRGKSAIRSAAATQVASRLQGK